MHVTKIVACYLLVWQSGQGDARCGRHGRMRFAECPTDQFTDQSATATLAMRQACKNILYTIGNSGYYTFAESDPSTAPDQMTTTFQGINIGGGVAIAAIEALAIFLLMRGKKKAQEA